MALCCALLLGPTTSLADREGFDGYLTGEQLHFLRYGRSATGDFESLEAVLDRFHGLTEESSELQRESSSRSTCKLFFNNNLRADRQVTELLEQVLEAGPNLIEDNPKLYYYSWARLETVTSFMQGQMDLVREFKEGGSSPLGLTNDSCDLGDRDRWVTRQKQRVQYLALALTTIWPLRGLINNFELSSWLAQQMIEKNITSGRRLGGLIAVSVIAWPITLKALPAVAAKVGWSVKLAKDFVNGAFLMFNASLGGWAAWNQFYRPPIGQSESEKFQKDFKSFLKTSLKSPHLYYHSIYEAETLKSQFLLQLLCVHEQSEHKQNSLEELPDNSVDCGALIH